MLMFLATILKKKKVIGIKKKQTQNTMQREIG